MSYAVSKNPCPKCGSSDNLVKYSDGGEWCFTPGCGYVVLGEEFKQEHGLDDQVYEHEEEGDKLVFQDRWNKIKDKTRTEGKGFRGIRDDIYAKFAVRHEYHTVLLDGEETEELVAQYYPLTTTIDDNIQVCGVKIRSIPKKFRAEGMNKQDKTHLFGQVNFLGSTSKTLVITSGECFPPDVEVMTEYGFKRFDELSKNERILQVNEDMTTSLVRPLAYIEKDYAGELIEFNSRTYRTICTPSHNVVYFDARGRVVKKEAKERVSARWTSPIVVQHEGDGIPLTNDQIALLLAVCADSKLDSRVNSNQRAHFSFMKQRKIQRLRGLLERLDIEYTSYTSTWSAGKTYTTFNFTLPDWIESKTIPFDWVLSATQVQREFILSELLHWDGNYSRGGWYEFTSKHLSECDTIYQLLILSGRYGHVRERSNKFGTWYVTSWHDEGKPQDGQSRERSKQRVEYQGKVYCVTVPSGMILTRYAGRTAVIGNCDHLATYQMLFDALGETSTPAVVSSTCGEAAYRQYQHQYEFLNKFEKIVIVPDSDEAGKKALKKAVQALPKDKVYVLDIPQVYKDPNAMLMAGKEKDFVTLYFRAKPYVPDGIVGSGELFESMKETNKLEKIPLPPFMHELEEMLNGGFTLESIVNIVAASGLGGIPFINKGFEQWKRIETFDSYLVSNFGRVFSEISHKFLKPDSISTGHRRVILSKDGEAKRFSVHRLVATYFIPNYYDKPYVNHIDNNPGNNHVSNLEWCTHSENMIHAQKQGRLFKSQSKGGQMGGKVHHGRSVEKHLQAVGKVFGCIEVKSLTDQVAPNGKKLLEVECLRCGSKSLRVLNYLETRKPKRCSNCKPK